ncbi:ABC transporter permease subunit, partial [Chloroflexus sp.]|uniref:ABC transporter permease subunit n=1 Tax=Chloroflexus sp. TaxID=1904827 RepID=UPI003A1036B9
MNQLWIDIAAVLAAASPLVIAAMGETISERAGVINLSLDGTMLLAAMTGFAVAVTTQHVLLGFVAAALIGALVAVVLGVFS